MKKFISDNILVIGFIMLIAFSVLNKCANSFDGVSSETENLAKSIILEQYPTFERELQQRTKSAHPAYTGVYGYDFSKGSSEDVVIVKYGTSGVDWFEALNPFNNKQTSEISYSFEVNLRNQTINPVTCVSQDNWWSSQKTSCGN
jgi:hypothetical protein